MRKLIFGYLRMRMPVVILYLLVMILFPIINYFYSFPLEAISYGLVIFSFLCMLFGLFDFYGLYRRHQELQKRIHHISIHRPDHIHPVNLIEEDYEELIKLLYQRINESLNELGRKNEEQIGYFISWVHQIKTPISVIKLLLQKDKEAGQSIWELEREIFRVEQYVDMALQYLRLDHFENDLKIHVFSLDHEIKKMIKKHSTIFIQKKIALKYETIDLEVLSDEKWLGLIIEQILTNALKYTDAGSISIYTEGNALVIEDTGIGISADNIKRIFENGFTGNNGRMDKKSSGIGLFLAKRAATFLNIELMIESVVGKGTKVKIIFPENDKGLIYD